MRLLGRVMSEPGDHAQLIFAEKLRETIVRFTAALKRSLPELSDEDILWSIVFMAGAMVHTMSMSPHLHKMSAGLCDTSDVETIIRRLIPFLAGGIRAAANVNAAGGGQ
jgi:hypothetical protein